MIRIGLSGWSYPEWRGRFYPVGLPQRAELAHLADRMSTVEINGSFYSLQRPSSYRHWYEQAPDGFCFAVKGGRYLTHLRRLREPHVPLANFLASGVLALRDKLGPLLWQLPADLAYDPGLIREFLALLPHGTEQAAELGRDHSLAPERTDLTVEADRPLRHAIEPRHASFRAESCTEALRAAGIALVSSDSPGAWPCFEERTADFDCLRLHGHSELYSSAYATATLEQWAGKLRSWAQEGRDAYVYFDNTAKGAATEDARRLADLFAA